MASPAPHESSNVRVLIEASLAKAIQCRDGLKRKAFRCTLLNMILTALAASIAGMAGFAGKKVGGDWFLTCKLAAGFAAGATVVTGVQKQVADPALLAKSSECVGKLHSLKIQSVSPDCDLAKLMTEYLQVVETYPDILS